MKRVLIIIMALVCMTVSAQTNEGKRPVYCTIMGYNAFGFGKVKVQLDMGDYAYHSSRSYDSLFDESGKKMKFNTMVEVLNYMGERGWRLVDSYPLTIGRSNVLHYVMEKWIKDESERKEGLILKEDKESGESYDDTYFVPQKKEDK